MTFQKLGGGWIGLARMEVYSDIIALKQIKRYKVGNL